MRLRKKWWARPEMAEDEKSILNPYDQKGKWKEIFGNDHPIHVELGCGKGQFISTLAKENPDINYIAIDLKDEVLVFVLRKINELGLTNVRIIPMFIERIDEIFTENEVSKLYINFCNPWPKASHNKRRLTHPRFLKKYKGFIRPGTEVWFKTDDDDLFAASLDYFNEEGFREMYRTFDLEESGFSENIKTEYEEKFSSFGVKIKFGIFKLQEGE
ncbi:MAG TPA: tRNA (guanosine(46)-N7)-methyltransferase TrmB [Proteiniclasticum sp.]|jgi:tRNA (guanine-N7-)-methyltransferase|uniref:tRNA (guanosine(46)-N7)-methyltransferase TrmB n=1 Tax=Proteiniclasticum sp. TaxID=2053595 RepID=UPI000E7F5C91|nr:tRNA (guanosine(46)-N7)-methyltransferase TrmB [Proteiniclasticum sp.]HBW12799.1 tRNA (guanosine(46)-N7)-methyltransferase TrmB [Proteiniclasticum sp.]